MPQKPVKDDFVMWWHWHFILKCPKIEEFHFRFLFCFKIDHVLKFWNALFFLFDSENEAFQKISTWSILKQKRNRKWNSTILRHFKILCICHHVKYISFTCFLGQFMLPPVWRQNYGYRNALKSHQLESGFKINNHKIIQKLLIRHKWP